MNTTLNNYKSYLRIFYNLLIQTRGTWLYPALLALILSLIVYGLFPLIGLGIFQTLLAPKVILSIVVGLIGLVACSVIIYLCMAYPEKFLQVLVLYYVLAVCILAFLLKKAKVLPGSSSPFVITNFSSHELVILFAIPTVLIVLPHLFRVFKRFPYILFQLLFIGIFLIYLFYHNIDFPFPIRWLEGIPNPERWRLYQVQYAMLWYSVMISSLAATIIIRSPSVHDTFDRFNKALIVFHLIEAIVTILGVPLGMFQQNVDGHVRFKSRFIHPNAYGHHLAIFLVYCLGILLYYQQLAVNGYKRFPIKMLVVCFALNMAAFFLALSKGAISLSFISMFILLLVNFPFLIQNIKLVFQAIGAFLGLIPVGLLVIQVTKEGGIFGFVHLISDRVGDTDSFDWRTQAWANLLNNLSEPWIGHGLTSSSLLLHHISYHPKWNPLPLVIIHNTYYQLLYDMGIIGLVFFFLPFVFIVLSIIYFLLFVYPKHPFTLPLIATLLGVNVYYLLSMTIDEVNLYDLHLLYWPFTTLLYGMLFYFQSSNGRLLQKISQ